MKTKAITAATGVICLAVGFLLFPLFFSGKLSSENRQITIVEKLSVLDNLIVKLNNIDNLNNSNVILDILCQQLLSVEIEAKGAGEPAIKSLNHLDYSNSVINRFNQLANKSNGRPCGSS